MNGNARLALRHHEGTGRDVPSEIRLERAAAIVFGDASVDEEDVRAVVWAGQELLRADDDDPASTDIGFFLVAWGAEKIARMRIDSGDLGIDEAKERMATCRRGSLEWQEAAAEYHSLADEILIDTLNDFREFDLVLLYSGRPDVYARRRAAGMAQLAQLLVDEDSAPFVEDSAPFVFVPASTSPASVAMAG